MSFKHPGLLYLQKIGTIKTVEDFYAYADFLRTEAGLDGKIPIEIGKIYQYFNIPSPKLAPLPNQQGLLLDPENGVIIINIKDPARRQNFSMAHELVELLFSELPLSKEWGDGWFINRPGGFKEYTKERICNQTAADLLMPPIEVRKRILTHGSNFDCGRIISEEFDVSLAAALIQVARVTPDRCSIVLWRMKNKPTELVNQGAKEQLSLFEIEQTEGPIKKLRVEWTLGGSDSPYIPKNKSVEQSSLVFCSFENNIFTSGDEYLCFDGRTLKKYRTENQPFEVDGERMVISMIRRL